MIAITASTASFAIREAILLLTPATITLPRVRPCDRLYNPSFFPAHLPLLLLFVSPKIYLYHVFVVVVVIVVVDINYIA